MPTRRCTGCTRARQRRQSRRPFQAPPAADASIAQKLGAALAMDPKGFKRLESIVHPLVQAAEKSFLHERHARRRHARGARNSAALRDWARQENGRGDRGQRFAREAAGACAGTARHDGREARSAAGPPEIGCGETPAGRFRCGHQSAQSQKPKPRSMLSSNHCVAGRAVRSRRIGRVSDTPGQTPKCQRYDV